MKLTLGFSPCPNDTFIFDAMVNGRINTEDLEFDFFIADVEELNRRVFAAEPDISKISCHAYAHAAEDYLILDSGGAMGYGSGPLLVSKRPIDMVNPEKLHIAIPGIYTTANLLFSIAWPTALNKTEYLFSDIEDALLNDEADAGLIIHETRFTYLRKGLIKIADMGEFWESLTQLPVPLGVIAVNRRLPEHVALKVNRVIRRSLEYASANSGEISDFILSNSGETDQDVIESHISLFVNDFSFNLGSVGRNALKELFRISSEKGITPLLPEKIFLA
ncbi:MAG: 1,4-dihydroxy-6-naphthoate synthase [Bacteroidales bacterium]|jgi:1,4-dihydroxy-6-naphthoate synthase|nr:1,4-dihydroxy-6-naphthoate synthase [Bacteroidales bacterium]